MTDLLGSSAYFGLLLSLGAYGLGLLLQRRWKLPIFNPLLVAIVVVAVVLLLLDLDYGSYSQGANLLNYLLTPATVCLAVPLYEQFSLLRRHGKAVLLGIAAGVLASLVTILVLAWLFSLDHSAYVTLLPKSITTAIGIGVSEELGGHVSLTVVVIIITGVLGNIFAEGVCKVFRITEPVAAGVAIGTSTHAVGTARAMEMGEIQGAMSSLSIVVAGLLTVVGANLFAHFL
ncbi:MAG: LrgB family protein [Evtepia sp.]|uniref:LrgB family protein n=1 Tax=Evtepia sp. TaxID=2773933 RepID=UPI002A829676|nr:LrgB family protein [Evtepia sp.]MDY4429983.1 LrgB family protein [Evtepia sp.]